MAEHLGGTFDIGGDLTVHRLGFGAMRITGEGIWGPPKDPEKARATLRATKELGIDLIDTAESYGPYVSEQLIGEELAPYSDPRQVIATKSGLTRTGPGVWPPLGRPEFLRQGCEMSLRRLKLDSIPLFQLHRIDAKVPREEQFGVLKELKDEGKVQHVGLSEVSVEELQAAQEVVEIATVQNLYNVANRQSEELLDHCTEHGIGFIPWYPLAAGDLARPGGPLDELAKAHDATHGQIALAWLLHRSPVMLPIPGTGDPDHLRDNVKGAEIDLTQDQLDELDRAAG